MSDCVTFYYLDQLVCELPCEWAYAETGDGYTSSCMPYGSSLVLSSTSQQFKPTSTSSEGSGFFFPTETSSSSSSSSTSKTSKGSTKTSTTKSSTKSTESKTSSTHSSTKSSQSSSHSSSFTSSSTSASASAAQYTGESAESSNSSLSSGAKIGIAVGASIGGILLIVCIVFLVLFILRRRRKKQDWEFHEKSYASENSSYNTSLDKPSPVVSEREAVDNMTSPVLSTESQNSIDPNSGNQLNASNDFSAPDVTSPAAVAAGAGAVVAAGTAATMFATNRSQYPNSRDRQAGVRNNDYQYMSSPNSPSSGPTVRQTSPYMATQGYGSYNNFPPGQNRDPNAAPRGQQPYARPMRGNGYPPTHAAPYGAPGNAYRMPPQNVPNSGQYYRPVPHNSGAPMPNRGRGGVPYRGMPPQRKGYPPSRGTGRGGMYHNHQYQSSPNIPTARGPSFSTNNVQSMMTNDIPPPSAPRRSATYGAPPTKSTFARTSSLSGLQERNEGAADNVSNGNTTDL